MKNSTVFVYLIFLAFCCSPFFTPAQAGGNIGTGGNGTKSTIEDVKTAMDSYKGMRSTAIELVETIWNPDHRDFFNPCHTSDPGLRGALQVFLNRQVFMYNGQCVANLPTIGQYSSQLYEAVTRSKIIPNSTSACSKDPDHQDGSTQNKIGSDICISSFTMQRYPKHALVKELVGLFFHEVTHQFGFDEDVAKKMQTYVIQRLEQFGIFKAAIALQRQAAEIRSTSSGNDIGKKLELCMATGELVGLVRNSIIADQLNADWLPRTFVAPFVFSKDYSVLDRMTKICSNGLNNSEDENFVPRKSEDFAKLVLLLLRREIKL